MGVDYINSLHNLKPTELGNFKTLPNSLITSSATRPKAQEVKILEIHFPDQLARAMTITAVNRAIRNPAGINVNTGPIVGAVEWGVGGEFNRIEFNLPPAYTWQQNGGIGNPVQGQNGVNLTVFGSAFRLLGRNEARLPPVNDATAVQGSNIFDGEMGGFISQGTSMKPCGPMQRAIIVVSANGAALAAAGSVAIGIPRFAKRVRFPRQPFASTIDVTVGGDIAGSAYTESIGASSQGQIELSPLANTMQIANTSGAGITVLTAVFDLEI